MAGLGSASWALSAYLVPHLVQGPLPSTPPSTDARVSLVCWNLHKRTDSVMVADLARLLDSTRADLGLFQEAVVDSLEGGFSRAMGEREWGLSANLFHASPPREIGVATASSSKLDEATALLSDAGEPLAGTRKAALVTRHRFGGRMLVVANLHALNFSPRLGGFTRQLADIADRLRESGVPAIAAGDFNTWSRRKRDLADSLFGAAGLVRLDFGAAESLKSSAFGNALDHIYFTADRLEVEPSTIRVHTGIRSSDHLPLSATFRFRDAAEPVPSPSAAP